MRPLNGGHFDLAPAKVLPFFAECKVNGGRLVMHLDSGQVFNRHGQKSAVQKDFDFTKLPIKELSKVAKWVDMEGLSRRHKIAKGTLVVLDFIPKDPSMIYETRKDILWDLMEVHPLSVEGWEKPVYTVFSTHYKSGMDERGLWDIVADKVINPYDKFCNAVFEGIVSKQAGSKYACMRNDKAESAVWIKHKLTF